MVTMTVKRKKGVQLEYEEVLDWIFNNVDKKALEQAQTSDGFRDFCESTDPRYAVDLDGVARERHKVLMATFAAFTKARAEAAEKEKAEKALKVEKEKEGEPEEPDEGEGEDEDEDEPEEAEDVFTVLARDASPLGAALLQLEAVLSPIEMVLRSSGESKGADKNALFKKHADRIGVAVQGIVTCCSGEVTVIDVFQVYRMQATFEYGLLRGTSHARALDKALDLTTNSLLPKGPVGRQLEVLLELAHAQICKVWDISLVDFKDQLIGGKIRFAVHGRTRVSAQATPIQICAGLGEVLICMPLVLECHQLASTHGGLYTWDSRDLVIKMMQKTVRKHKLLSLYRVIAGIDGVKTDLLQCSGTGRITVPAWQSITSHLQSLVVRAVAYKAKEQLRQLRMLNALLGVRPALACVGYEVRLQGSAPIDLLFSDTANDWAAEVESVPDDRLADAHAYLAERYLAKVGTIGDALQPRQRLVLVVPDAHRLPAGEVTKIELDAAIRIWLV